LTFSRKARNILVVKVIILLIVSSLLGFVLSKEMDQNYQEIKNLSFEQYQQNFETYKAENLVEPLGAVGSIIITNIMIFFCFGIYELISYWLSTVISRKTEKVTSTKTL